MASIPSTRKRSESLLTDITRYDKEAEVGDIVNMSNICHEVSGKLIAIVGYMISNLALLGTCFLT